MYCIRSVLAHLRYSQNKINSVQRVINLKYSNNIRQVQALCYSTLNTEEDELDTVIDNICKGNEEVEKRLKVLMLEVEVMRQDGRHAPSSLKQDQWEHLMSLSSRNQRSNYLNFLWKNEMARENSKAKKEARRKRFEETMPEENKEFPDDLLYGIVNQSMFLRIRDQSINQFDNYRALQAMMYGLPIVIDCSYEEHMVWRETVNAAKQMTLLFGDNRIHKDPFNIHLCNVNLKGTFMKQLSKNIPSIIEPWFPLNIHTKSYLDIFQKEKLVYLTPHCRNELTEYDHDAVYIVGCMVDKMNNEPLSLAKAKKDNIKMAKLPLDRYLEWAPGAKKNLNINHMIPILSDLKLTRNWEYALRHIPRRKLMETKIMAMQKKLENNPKATNEVLKYFKNHSRFNVEKLREKRFKSKHSLYDDDSI